MSALFQTGVRYPHVELLSSALLLNFAVLLVNRFDCYAMLHVPGAN